jgi:hypothetical protein
MYRMPLSPRTSFQLFDASTGEPHLHCSGSLADRHYLSRLERDPRELHLRTAIAVHLPRFTLMACGAAAILFGFVVLGKAEGPASTSSAGRITAECAERDLQAIAFIEQRGEAADLPSATLAELGFKHLQARVDCAAGQEASALAIYDDILSTVRTAERPAGAARTDAKEKPL